MNFTECHINNSMSEQKRVWELGLILNTFENDVVFNIAANCYNKNIRK